MRKGGDERNYIRKVVYIRGRENTSSNEVNKRGFGRKYSKVRGGSGAKGSRLMNSKEIRICLSNNTIIATG
jgi:hypothetical protein